MMIPVRGKKDKEVLNAFMVYGLWFIVYGL
jgi:hypothetical protein